MGEEHSVADEEKRVEEAQPAEDAPVPKMTRPEFIARLDQLVAEGEVAGLPTAQIIASRFAREGTKRITSLVDGFLDGLAGSQ